MTVHEEKAPANYGKGAAVIRNSLPISEITGGKVCVDAFENDRCNGTTTQ